MRNFYFVLLIGNQKRYFQRYEEAKECHESTGGKIYAYTKDLKPKKLLCAW